MGTISTCERPLNIAVTGNAGVGKSSYINAIRGLTTYDERASAVGVNKASISPTPYPHPKNTNLIIWNLPGVGTRTFTRESYFEKVDFQRYDVFLIICNKRFTENDLWLVETVRQHKKKLYCVRTCIDNDLSNEIKFHPRTFNREKTLEDMRNDLVQQLGSNTDVFLIDSYNTSEYDFPRLSYCLLIDAPGYLSDCFLVDAKRYLSDCLLVDAPGYLSDRLLINANACKEVPSISSSSLTDGVILQNETQDLKRINMGTGTSICIIPEDEKESIKQHFMKYGVDGIKNMMKTQMNEWKTIPLNIAVTGNSGSGKSSYINTIRGLTADDEGAAAVGVTETTTSPTPYPHPKNTKLIFWDLPGIGTPNLTKENYLEEVDFQKYDFFFILCKKRFTDNDLWLVETVRKQNKTFYCVRTSIDDDLNGARKSHPRTFNREKTLEDMRADLIKQLGSNTDVFLIDSYNTSEYDFARLSDRLLNDAPALKKDAMILSFSTLTDEVILQKRYSILKRVNRISSVYQVLFGVLNIPLNVISVGIHAAKVVEKLVIKLIVSEANKFRQQFDLTDGDLKKCADSLNIPVEELRQQWNLHDYQPTFVKSDLERIVKLNEKESSRKKFLAYFPILSLFYNIIVSNAVKCILKGFTILLDEMVEDAKKVIRERSKRLIT